MKGAMLQKPPGSFRPPRDPHGAAARPLLPAKFPNSCRFGPAPPINRGFWRRGGALFTSAGVGGGKERRKHIFKSNFLDF